MSSTAANWESFVAWDISSLKVVAGLLLTLLLTTSLYRIYLSPHASFPGPRLWAVTRIPLFYHHCRGRLPHQIAQLHDKYGPVVRVAPTELSFSNDVWNDIYQRPLGGELPLKDPLQLLPPTYGALGIFFEFDNGVHSRLRRHFSHAFSDKSLRDQEPVVIRYVDQLISKLQEQVGKEIDIVSWYNFVNFDIIGDLVFGESFDCLNTSTLHVWIETIFNLVAASSIAGATQRFWGVTRLIRAFLPKKMRIAGLEHGRLTEERLTRRLEKTEARSDFLSYAIKQLDQPNGLTYSEILATSISFIIGGSETMASTLSFTTYFLLRNPLILRRLLTEIRSTFSHPSEITFFSVSPTSLPYLSAVLNETFRLLPPVSGTLRRITPPGGYVIGDHFVPSGTVVSIESYAAGHSADNFARVEEFIPERWMADAPEEFRNDQLKVVQPFSVGPRNCIGKNLANAQVRVLLARVLWGFDLFAGDCEGNEKRRGKGEGVEGWAEGMRNYAFFEKGPLMIRLEEVKRG